MPQRACGQFSLRCGEQFRDGHYTIGKKKLFDVTWTGDVSNYNGLSRRGRVGLHSLQGGHFHAPISSRQFTGSSGCDAAVSTGRSFWLNGSALEYPNFDNAETFVERLVKMDIVSRDPVIEDTLLRRPGELSLRSAQRHFLRSTGITYATFRQIERARYATNLLREGVSIFDVIVSAGYVDQAHLTRSLRHFIGETPAKIIQGQKQLSFLYNTNPSTEL
jgi:AraC-like DNA-binding protein